MARRLFSCDLSRGDKQSCYACRCLGTKSPSELSESASILRFLCSHLTIVAASKLLEGTSQSPGRVHFAGLLALPHVPSSYRRSTAEAFYNETPEHAYTRAVPAALNATTLAVLPRLDQHRVFVKPCQFNSYFGSRLQGSTG